MGRFYAGLSIALALLVAIGCGCHAKTMTKNLAYKQLMQLANREAFKNMLYQKYTGTGLTYQNLIGTATSAK